MHKSRSSLLVQKKPAGMPFQDKPALRRLASEGKRRVLESTRLFLLLRANAD
jgi:hypothetical protein